MKLIPPNPAFKERIEDMLTRQEFMKHIKFNIFRIEAGLVEGELTMEKCHEQQFGILHGGVVSTLADTVAGFAAYTLAPAEKDTVTAEIKISYYRKSTGGKIRAIGKVVKPSKQFAFVEAEVFSFHEGKEKLVARATSTMVYIDN